MRVSLAWLRELVAIEREDPKRLAALLTARGLTVDQVLDQGGDTVLDIDVPANRPDCLGHLGVAREIAAATGRPLLARPGPPPGTGDPVDRAASVSVESDDLCPRYTARVVRGVRVAPSPPEIVARLEACGLRSINNVVDVSNLVLLETGQPVHTFDLDRVRAGRIRVRRARADERLTTLDGVERRLDSDMLVIAGEEDAIALGGVLGGAATEIGAATRNVLVEAASFLPRSVRRTAKRLGLVTDASQRFERGVDPEAVLPAQDLAASLLASLAGGVPAPGTLDVRGRAAAPRTLVVRRSRVRLLLGFDPGLDAMRDALQALSLAPVDEPDGAFRVTVPSFRVDLEREADLVEEIGRHVGYDRIPSKRPDAAAVGEVSPVRAAEERARDLLADLGFHEATSYAMVPAGDDAPFVAPGAPEAIAIVNPIAEGLARLRRSLLPGLLRAVDLNLRRGSADARLFEVGRVFERKEPGQLPAEPHHVALAWSGAASARWYGEEPREVALEDVAGVAETLLRALRPSLVPERVPVSLPGLHPGRSLGWSAGGRLVGVAGEVHPDLRASLDLKARVLLAEVDLEALASIAEPPRVYRTISRVPAVSRDLSLVLPHTVAYRDVVAALATVAPPAPATFELVDRYEGPPLVPGQVSMTVRVILQPAERTLQDAETEDYRSRLVAALERSLPAKLRA